MACSGVSSPATLWTLVVSSASSSVSGGQMPGMRLASIDFPLPGGPIISTLWPPATATSMRALHVLLALHVGEVVLDGVELAEDFVRDRSRTGRMPRVPERNSAASRRWLHRIDFEARDHGRLRRVGGGQDEALVL